MCSHSRASRRSQHVGKRLSVPSPAVSHRTGRRPPTTAHRGAPESRRSPQSAPNAAKSPPCGRTSRRSSKTAYVLAACKYAAAMLLLLFCSAVAAAVLLLCSMMFAVYCCCVLLRLPFCHFTCTYTCTSPALHLYFTCTCTCTSPALHLHLPACTCNAENLRARAAAACVRAGGWAGHVHALCRCMCMCVHTTQWQSCRCNSAGAKLVCIHTLLIMGHQNMMMAECNNACVRACVCVTM